MKNIFIIISLFVFTQNTLAQKEGNNWIFNVDCYINFDNNKPNVINSQHSKYYGNSCASISTKKGRLLLYSPDALHLYDSLHYPIKMNNRLNGAIFGVQNVIIVPHPDSINLYYVFSTATYRNGFDIYKCLYYSVVDMNIGGGKGGISNGRENVVLIKEPISGGLSVVKHPNNRGFWIITSLHNTDTICAFLLKSEGITNSIKSVTGDCFCD